MSKSNKISKNQASKVKNITLQELLEQKYGKEKVKVVKWKWTPEQLEQLEKKKNER